jgi:hypothetical protein
MGKIMKLAIMQPYFFPYVGYFQLMSSVDEFIIYDNIEFSKNGWINRNRILVSGKDSYITLPLRKDSDYLGIRDRFLSDRWLLDRRKMLNRIVEAYRRAPEFKNCYEIIEKCLLYEERNLFNFLFNSLKEIKKHLEIYTPIQISSTISYDNELKGEKKVIAICKSKKADIYINPIGAQELGLYNSENFYKNNIKLFYLKSDDIVYKQFNNVDFVPWLSIIDVMMFNSREEIREILNQYELV